MGSKSYPFPVFCKEVLQPRSVQHALFCNFVDPDFKSLVLFSFNHLTVYNLVYDINKQLKFDYLLSYNVNCNVKDAASVKFYGDGLESLILCFDEAVLTIVNFDIFTREIKLNSIHNFEHEKFKMNRTQFAKIPMLRVDPMPRCATFLFFDKKLAVIPFRHNPKLITDTSNAASDSFQSQLNYNATQITQAALFDPVPLIISCRPTSTLTSYVIHLNELPGVKIGYIIDMQFLYGYYEPTLLILYDPVGTFVGQALTRKDTCCMMTLSLNLQKKTNPIIWQMPNLPYDCFKLLPVPRPIGGIVIISPNILIYLNQSQPSCGFAMNGYAKKTTNFPLRHVNLFRPLTLSNCVAKFINCDQIFIITADGELFTATLILEPVMRTVTGIHIVRSYTTVVPTCMLVLSPNYLFVGSHMSSSQLIKYDHTAAVSNDNSCNGDSIATNSASNDIFISSDDCALNHNSYNLNSYTITLNDELFNIGPLRSMSVCENANFIQSNTSSTAADDQHHNRLVNDHSYVEMVATVSQGKHGAICLLNETIKPCLQLVFELSNDITDVFWSKAGGPLIDMVPVQSASAHNTTTMSDDDTDDDFLPSHHLTTEYYTTTSDDQARTINTAAHTTTSTTDPITYHSFMLLSKARSTMVLEIGKEIEELEVSGFITDEPTISVGNISAIFYPVDSSSAGDMGTEPTTNSYPLTYQVTRNSIRLLNGSQMLLHRFISESDCNIIDCHQAFQSGNDYSDYLVLMNETCQGLFVVYIRDGKHVTYGGDALNEQDLCITRHNMRPELIMSYCAFVDVNDWLIGALDESHLDFDMEDIEQGDLDNQMNDVVLKDAQMNDVEVDEVDLMLYAPTHGQHHQHGTHGRQVVISNQLMNGYQMPELPDGDDDRYFYGVADVVTDGNTHEAGGQGATHQPRQYHVSSSTKVLHDSVCPTNEELSDQRHQDPTETGIQSSKTYCMVLYHDGILEMYSLPDMKLCYQTNNFYDLPIILLNLLKVPELEHLQACYSSYKATKAMERRKTEICVYHGGRKMDRPILFVRDDAQLTMYEFLAPVPKAARYTRGLGDYLRLKKINKPCLIKSIKKAKEDYKLNELNKQLISRQRLFKPFNNIANNRGILLSGSYPLWIFIGTNGQIFTHSMYVEGVLHAFATNPIIDCTAPLNYHNSSNAANNANYLSNFAYEEPQFAYFNTRAELKFMELPRGYNYAYPQPVKLIAFKKTVKYVQYHLESKTFAVVSCVERPVHSIFKLNAENSKEEEKLVREPDLIRATMEQYYLEFFAPHLSSGSWETVPHAHIGFEPWDKVSAMAIVQLQLHSAHAPSSRDILAVGSNLTHGEEVPVRGKILLVDLVDVVPHRDRPLTRHKLKALYDQEQKGPVTALSSCRGLLVSALGQKIYIWQLRDGELVGIAFVDSVHLLVDQLHCVRDMIIAGAGASIQLLRFQPELRVLSLVARNSYNYQLDCVMGAVNFLPSMEELCVFSVQFETGIMTVYRYEPTNPYSHNGKVLISCASIKMCHIQGRNSLRMNDRWRHPLIYSTPTISPCTSNMEIPRQSIYISGPAGSIQIVVPIHTQIFTDLCLVDKHINLRIFSSIFSNHENATYQNIQPLDCLLQDYLQLPHSHRLEIATKSGLNHDNILNNLMDLAVSSSIHF